MSHGHTFGDERQRAREHALHEYTILIRRPSAFWTVAALTILCGRQEGTIGPKDHFPPVVPVPPRVLQPRKLLIDLIAFGSRRSLRAAALTLYNTFTACTVGKHER